MTHSSEMLKKTMHQQVVMQWITSLAISVVCCAVLFVVFAGYIVELHETSNLQTVKLELLLERHNQLQNEIAVLRRAPMVQINGVTGTPTIQQQAQPAPATVPPSTSPDGLQLPEPEAMPDEPLKSDMPPIAPKAERAPTSLKKR